MNDTRSDVWLRVTARAENVAVARQALAGLCEAIGANAKVLADVKLAVTEACTNVVVHAYRDSDAEPFMDLEAHPDGDELLVVVRDYGVGISPRAESPGLGLGLPLIAALARSVNIRSGPDSRGTEVVMTFSLDDDGESVSDG
jgi:anti-sigma regulatory factor (Ser/Thr protein kinase)